MRGRGKGEGVGEGEGGARTYTHHPRRRQALADSRRQRVPPQESIAVSTPFGYPQRRSRIYFYFLFFDTPPAPPPPVNKPPALFCPQRQAPPQRPVCRQSELLPSLPLPLSGGLVGEPEGW